MAGRDLSAELYGSEGGAGRDLSAELYGAKQPVKDAGFSLGDIAKSFGIGAVGSTKALTDVAGAENVVSSKLGKGVESLQQSLTPERQAEMQRQAARMKAAEESGSVLQEIKAGALNVAEAPLQSAAQAIGSFVPYLPALFASPIATAMGLTGRSLSAITAVAQQAPKVIGTAQGAGAVKGSIYDGVLRAEIEAGVNPEAAKQKAEAAQSYFGGNFDQIALGAGLGLAAGSTGVEKFLTSAGRAGAAPGVARRVAGATVAESLPEAAQGGQERVAENIALQRAGYDVDTFKGVAGAATQEALTGALGAAPIAAMVRPEVKPPESVDTFEKEKEEFRKGFGKAEPVAAPTEERAAEPVEQPTQFPGGYTATRREISRQDVPESFGIFAQGSDKPLTTVAKQDEVEKKLQSLTEIRQEEQARLLQESDKISKSIQDEQRKLEVMEATGQTDTDQYVQAKALLAQKEEEAGLKLQDINDKIASYSAPLSFAPIGSRVDVQNEFVVNRGDQPVGVFPTLEQAELTLREREPEAFKQAEVAARTQEVAARTQELETKLKPMLAKFNLGDVGLNIVEQLENDAGGSYLDRLIKVSLEEANPIQTMRHESLHALKDLGFFTPQQWKALTEQANNKWIKEYLENQTSELDGVEMSRLDAYKKIGLTQEEIVEEAIADAFGAYDRGATPPPGMIAALFKKLKNFFANFNQALRGAGFESADDVFQRVERGELKSRKPKAEKAEPKAKPEEKDEKPEQTMGERLSLLRKAYPDEIDISTQNPQGVKRIYDPITEMLSIDEAAVREAMKANPKMAQKTIQAIKSYGFIPDGTPNNKVLELFRENIINNLMFLYNKVPSSIRNRSKLWYDGANKIAKEMADNYDMSLRQIAAIMAAMSPQKDWFQNVSMAERAIDVLKNQGDQAWTPDMLKYAESYVKETQDRKEREKRQDAFEKIKRVAKAGTVLNDMDEKSAAAFVRAYDEAFHSRNYRIVTPEGGFGDLVKNNDGTPSTMMWSTYGPIEKTVSIFRDGSRENVSQQLGFEHKIRSFYNNIANPNSEIDHVTIDTHAVAAALFEALAGTDTEVTQNFGGTGSSDVLGVGGTYGLIADAYREAAKRAGVRAREMQSITWEAVRALFSEEVKSTIKPKIRAEWKKYKTGQQSFDETRNNVLDIAGQPDKLDEPDWIDSGVGQFVSDGGTSYDKTFTPTDGVRLRKEREIREKVTFNLSAVTNSIPGLRELYSKAMKGDDKAYELLQKVAESSLQYLLKGSGAKVKIDYAKGVYLSDREPSISVSAAFDERNQRAVMGALAKFAENYNQQQIHVRVPTIRKVGHDFGDGSYATPVYEIPLRKKLNNAQISDIINQTGLQGFSVSERQVVAQGKTVTENFLTAYWVAPNDIEQEFASFDSFEQAVRAAQALAGVEGSKPKQSVERLYVYGEGSGARISYEDIQSDLLSKEGTDTVTPRLISEYLRGEPIKVFKQKDLTNKQVESQKLLAKVFDELPTKDLKNPLVRSAYNALNKELVQQYNAMPIKVQLVEGQRDEDGNFIDIYKNSAEMRRDVSDNNRFKVYKTEAGTFGPEGFDFKDHPLLKDSGVKDADGKAMLFNDVLRAVHDYYAHNLSDIQFGPKGEAAAWRNHMSVTANPLARWALTAETRAQNAWQNFREGVEDVPLKDRPYADQKAMLPPINFTFTGEEGVDRIMADYAATLTPEQQLGSLPANSRYAAEVRKQMPKLSLRTHFSSVKAAKDAVAETEVPKTEEFKRFIAGNQWTDADGSPKVFYHATAREFFEFTPAGQSQAIFLADTPEEAETFGSIAEDRLRREIYRALGKDEKLTFFQNIVDAQVKNGSMSEKQGSDFMRQAKRKVPEYGDFGDIEQETYDALLDLSPTRMSIMPLYARAETPFEFENPDHVEQVMQWVANNTSFPQDFPDKWLAGMKGRIKQGLWQAIEDKRVQQAIRALGHDSFTVRENRNSPKNYAVYKPEQVKSVTGNIGEFSGESKDIRYSLKKARYGQERFEKVLGASMYTQNDAETKTKGYLGFVRPMDFVYATASRNDLERLREEQEPVDFSKLKLLSPIGLQMSKDSDGNWRIIGHEGRHRMLALADDGYREIPVFIEFGSGIANAESISTKSVEAQFPDSINSSLLIADLEPLSYANQDKAREKFTRMESKVKYSLPNIPTNIDDRIGETTFKRQEKGFVERMVEAISPQSASSFRQRYLNRYNQMSVYDKKRAEQMGGAALLADQSAEAAALMSDLGSGIAASAMGLGDRNGGIPILRNGITTIDTSVKGLIASLSPLAAYGDPAVYQRYQYWAMVKRGQRLNREGKLTGIDTSDVAFAKLLEQKHPEFASVQKDLIAFNNGLVKYMVDTGVLSKERANEYTKHADYIPFYRQMDGNTTLGPNLFQSLSGVKPPKKLKGKDVAEAPLADFLETMVRNTQSAIQAGVKNYAGQRAIDVASQVKAPGMGVERLNTKENGPDIINVLEKGNLVSYRTPDPLLVNAVSSLNLSELPFMGILSAPADLLRNLVTKDPGFMMANLLRDSLSAWVTSGQKMTPIAGTVISFGKALTRNSPGFEAMQNAGIIGGYEFSANVEQSGFKLEEDLARKAGKRTDSVLLRPFTSVWDALETGTTASDAATRALIYERVLADTGNEAEALYRSLEVMNFHRKGNSALIRVLTAAVPFFNARLQGLDLFYRASTGNMNNKDAAAIQRQFFARGMTMMALSTAYWFMVSDDEEYKNQEQETRDNNWIIPAINARIPIPFEVGVLFKVIPERIVAYTFGDDTGQDLRDSLFRNAMSTFAFNPIPQTAKPIIEAAFNFNTFTWRPIVSEGMKDVDPQFQVGPSTSIVAKGIGQALGLSPMKVDHIIKGYTGTIGMYGIDTIDMVLDQFGDSPKPTKRFEQLPVIKRFALDAEARGSVTQYYQLKDAVDTTVRTMNLLEKQGESEEYVEYLTKNQGTLAFKDYIRDTEKTMKDLREMRNAVRISQMTGDEKRDALLEITKAENAVTSQIQTIKKSIASVQ